MSNKRDNHRFNPPQPQQIKVDISTLEVILCPCGSDQFIPTLGFRKLPALLSPDGREAVVNLQWFACRKCGTNFENPLVVLQAHEQAKLLGRVEQPSDKEEKH